MKGLAIFHHVDLNLFLGAEMFPFLWKALGAENSCCQGGANIPAEVIQPEAKPISSPIDEGSEALGNLAVEISHSENSGHLAPIQEEPSSLWSSTALASPRGLKRMRELRHMEVDLDVTRGIPLHLALRRSELWTSPNEIRRRNRSAEVWDLSTNVTSLDIFLSHTWKTKGRWKILALTMQSGWLHGLMAWFVGVATMLCLRGFDIIDDPLTNVEFFITGRRVFISLSPWTVIASQISLVIGLLVSLYIPFKTQKCFLDAACIHQEDADKFESGLYNIGGCLSVAKELRVLYTPIYLSSLWCVFELTGFRKVNFEGKLRFAPLFIERSAMICTLFQSSSAAGLNFAIGAIDDRFRQRNAYLLIPAIILLLPIIFFVHTLRYNYREKLRLILDLKAFNVDHLHCASDFDRAFILSAIESWYGSKEAFNDFVRGALREELLGLLPSPHLPCSYAALIFSGQLAWSLDFCVSFLKAGVRFEEIPPFFLAQVSLCVCWLWFALNAIFYLSDRSAAYGGTWLCDSLKTLVVAAGPFSFTFIGFALWIQVIRSTSLAGLTCYVVFSMLLPLFILDLFKICWRRCQPWEIDATKSGSLPNQFHST